MVRNLLSLGLLTWNSVSGFEWLTIQNEVSREHLRRFFMTWGVFLPRSSIWSHNKRPAGYFPFSFHWILAVNRDPYFMVYEILPILWVFPKIGVPQNGWFIMVPNSIKMDDLGVKNHYFRKHNWVVIPSSRMVTQATGENWSLRISLISTVILGSLCSTCHRLFASGCVEFDHVDEGKKSEKHKKYRWKLENTTMNQQL